MRLQTKLFLVLLSTSLMLVGALVFLVQRSIDEGVLDYINSQQHSAVAPAVEELQDEYRSDQWHSLKSDPERFYHTLHSHLENGGISIPQVPRNGPNARVQKRPPPPRRLPPDSGRYAEQSSPINQKAERPAAGTREANQMRRPPPKASFERQQTPTRRLERLPGFHEFVVTYASGEPVVGRVKEGSFYSELPINVDEEIVGYLHIVQRMNLSDVHELDFVKEQHQYMITAGLVLLVGVLGCSIPLGRHMLSPVKRLTQGLHQLAQGQYDLRMPTQRSDELGQLGRDFNELAMTLEQNESARKRWLADAAHELRTPVAVLRGELEAMIDGIRPLSEQNVQSAHQELSHLQKLIDDLHALTRAEAGALRYQKQQLNLNDLIRWREQSLSLMLANAGIELVMSLEAKKCMVEADPTRLNQLFDNLVQNTIRYAHGATQLVVSTRREKHSVVWQIEDDGEGVAAEHLPKLFDHLYRVDEARTRSKGGSGLGLAICKKIIVAHQASVEAETSQAGGLAIIMTFPTVKS
ncbi:ATP-binding protein [Echinimonas agarilytica]|uniref:histidine kinase n=1 Tax=Echinimonas agarilytica TaxID=1215918 RepID=A0AA41W5Q8_9GAMM|nr:ATP-binding protein [Echinimonas agarilytica]MCM2679380.1 ATP-binding protein [Echinimonas agarilytica]